MSNEIKTINDELPVVADEQTPMAMINAALAARSSPETLERLMAMQERWEASQAKKAFVGAMTAFKRNPPEVFKNHTVDFSTSKGRTHYKHATLDNVCDILNEALAKHEISFRWETESLDHGIVRVTCILTHSLGHSEDVSLQSAPDASGGKNSIQAIGSAVTYLQRYTLLAATGIAVQGQDDDGAAGKKAEKISDEHAETIKARIMAELDDDSRAKFMTWLRVGAVNDLNESDYPRVIAALDKKAAQNENS